MQEKEPLYFKSFREYVEKKFEEVEKGFGEAAVSTAQGFHEVHECMDKLEEDITEVNVYINKIDTYIGRCEIRMTYLEDTFIKDHGRRIGDLEKAYLAS